MKTTLLSYAFILFILSTQISAQTDFKATLASRLLYFNSSGYENKGDEILLPLSDSVSLANIYSMKTLRQVDGTYYQVLESFKTGEGKVYLRKSTDGISWSELIRVGDSPEGIREQKPGIFAWKKNEIVYVGVTFADNRNGEYQLRFALSADDGQTFDSSVVISNHSGSSFIYNGALDGKGDTLVACWVPQFGNYRNKTFFNYSLDGGISWNIMNQVYSQGQYSAVTDLTIDLSGNIWVVTAADQYYRKNLVVRFSSDFGNTWQTKTQVTNQSSPNINDFPQIRFFNDKLYVIWTHTFNSSHKWSDSVFFSMSSDGGNSWRTRSHVSDTDTIMYGNQNWPYYCHPSFDITLDGTIYAVWADSRERNDYTIDNSKFNIYISRSTDNGLTWSNNIRVNDSDLVFNRNYWADVSVKSNGGIDTVLVTWTKYRDTTITGILTQENEIPSGFNLSQNYPNPFNPTTKIRWQSPISSHQTLKIYDLLGREVVTLVDEFKPAGSYEIQFDASGLTSGIYFYKLQAGNFISTKKFVLMK